MMKARRLRGGGVGGLREGPTRSGRGQSGSRGRGGRGPLALAGRPGRLSLRHAVPAAVVGGRRM